MGTPIFDEPQGNKTDPAYIDRSRRHLDGKSDEIKTHVPSDAYRSGWDRIWGGKDKR